MKIVCDREKMLAAFSKAALVAPARSPKAILMSVKVVATDGGVEFLGTDLEVSVRSQVEAAVEESGSAMLPVRQFAAMLSETSGDKVSLSSTDKEVVVKVGRSRFKLPVQNPDEFPAVTGFDEEKYHKVPARLFKELIHRTLFATDTESSRYMLGGVLLEMDADKITAVATDGRRLAKMEGAAESVAGHSTEGQVILPKDALALLAKVVGDGEVFIAARKNDVIIKADGVVFYTRRLEGRFPAWKNMIPERPEAVRIALRAENLLQAVRQSSIVTDDESRGVSFSFSAGKLVLHSSADAKGSSEVELPVDYEGEPIGCVLHSEYISEFLRALKGDESACVLEVVNETSAAVFRVGVGYLYVAMPMIVD